MKIRLRLLFFFFSFYCTAYGNVFVVTSNADSGVGTLREALTLAAANGAATQDYINFNLSGNTTAERTITLKTELPFLSSNLVLDATTQPGAFLGITQSKILVRADRFVYQSSDYYMGGFNIVNISGIEIYGFCFDQFFDIKVKTNPSGQESDGAAISILSSRDIIIGAPGKGNVFMQNEYNIFCLQYNPYPTKLGKIKVQSNWFGLNLVGTLAGTQQASSVRLIGEECEFGGPDQSYGNTMAGNVFSALVIAGTNCLVKHNFFGFNKDGAMANFIFPINLSITNGEMSDNQASRFALVMSYCKDVKIIRNTELAQSQISFHNGIHINESTNIQIGTDDINDVNTFLPSSNPLYNQNSTNVEVRKNIIHCTPFAYSINGTAVATIRVLVNNDSEYSGVATANSEVYIYNDYTDCSSCSPLQFYTKVNADAMGNWKITGDFRANKFIANATLTKSSSEFTQPQILTGSSGYWYTKNDASCGQNNGSLEIINIKNSLKVEWYTNNDVKVGEGTKIENLPPGRYYAKIFNGKCYTTSPYPVDLTNVEPRFTTTNLKVQQPGCGLNNGSIKGLNFSISGTATYKWINQNNNIIPSANLDLNNIGPGSYTLVVTTSGNCSKSYGPITLTNTDGPNFIVTNEKNISANCDRTDGSITGITATGTGNIQYTWKDIQGKTLAQTSNLNNVVAGRYFLEVKDESACGPIVYPAEIKEVNGIAIDISGKSTVNSTCFGSNGSITGVSVTGATAYKWLDEQNNSVSTNLNLSSVGPGTYRLIASNLNCTRESIPITISLQPNLITIGGFSKILINASCGLNNGKIEALLQNPTILPKSYRWENSARQTQSSTSLILSNIDAGTYYLYGKDDNNCEILLTSYTVDRTPILQLKESGIKILSDKCSQNLGGIIGLSLSGGVLPYSFKWINENGVEVGTSLDLSNVASGNYQLFVTDALACAPQVFNYYVPNQSEVLFAPKLNSAQLCAPGDASLKINNPIFNTTYLLYDKEYSSEIISSTTNGIFNIRVYESKTYYVSQRQGSCESSRTEVKINIGLSTLNIHNTITPNNDNINDDWQIKSIENYPKVQVKIFNRLGIKVFESVGYHTPFNGTMGGKPLPIGTYYYIINFGSGCNPITGDLTIIR
ncbi:MAG: gliding motility-associated C-terminal domain-containing protein [Bacteroidota bacterium]